MSKINKNQFDVVAIGNAIVDLLINTDDSFLIKNSLKKGTMTLIQEAKAKELYEKDKTALITSGGSAANTISGLSQLGDSTAFIGRVMNDELGDLFQNDICSTGAVFNTIPIKSGPSTARCFIYITPDAERTMCTYLGSSVFLSKEDIDYSVFNKAKILYLEGYLWDLDSAKIAIIEAAKKCKSLGLKIALSLSDKFCIERHRDSFQSLIEDYIDIVFANENEIIALYESKGLKEAEETIKRKCDIAVITKGKEGSIILSGKDRFDIKAYIFGNAVDTTGAGDLYASGFLHGYILGKDLSKCGEMGSICAGHIVTQIGSRSKVDLKKLLKEHLK